MPELSDLPVEILQMIAERCDFRPRFNLRSTSKLMKEVVDQSKFVLRHVRLRIRDPRLLRANFTYTYPDGTWTKHNIKMENENTESMEKAAKWIANILKNAEIECFDIFMRKDFLQKVKDNLKSPLKASSIFGESEIDPFWIFDKSYCQYLTCWHDEPNFFQEHSDTLMNLVHVSLKETMNITDEDVLSMKGKLIFLKSENFSAGMINQLVDKFIAKAIIDSMFDIENPRGNFIPEIKIPNGFTASIGMEGGHEKTDGDKGMLLKVTNERVFLKIIRITNNANGNGV